MTTPPTLTTLPVGFVINGRYQVRAALGTGANGAVYEVYDHNAQQISALKLLLRYNPTSPWAEAQALIGLEGEFILPVRNADHASGTPFVVTEVARNGTVADRIVHQVGVPTADAVRWTQQACRGIARIHDRGLIHNDIKPDNLFLSANDNVLVGDLGLVSLLDSAGRGELGGTVTTMAPEVAAIIHSVPPPQWGQHRPTQRCERCLQPRGDAVLAVSRTAAALRCDERRGSSRRRATGRSVRRRPACSAGAPGHRERRHGP